jgi:hypothetical protein
MASSQDFFKAATNHGLKPKIPSSCQCSWPQAKYTTKLQLLMASSQDFHQTATIHGLKPRFPASCNYSWPQAKNSSKLQVFMASSKDFLVSYKCSWPRRLSGLMQSGLEAMETCRFDAIWA